ncbi:PAS domain S-box-containing protein [Litorivivens lipolytica]|uniref:histidine kinase n=1 Tax=Litorivivens lipolytica TaxID=1524264 RepID=A0A7W4W6D7_9GAMM|nr:response regulator [Litorivivens lipolytica]MBB3047682.1 PAS domain S-box-containing protein [Litorivivens lipolytica]
MTEAKSTASKRSAEQVLLVDDNPTNLQVLYKTLEHSGYTLLAARDGPQALSIAEKAIPSLILLDIMMPDMDGFEVCRRLKANEQTRGIPIIFLSALTDTDAKVKGFSLGAVDYVSKPFQAEEVRSRVRTQLRIHRLEMQLARRNAELEDENFQILRSVSEAIFSLDRQGRISSVNPQAEALVGRTDSQCIGEALFDFFDFQAMQSHIEEVISEGKLLSLDQVEVRARDGRELTLALYCAALEGDKRVVVLRDITEWLENQKALQSARDELHNQRQHLAHMERLSTGGEMAAGIAHEVNQPLTAVSNYAIVAQRFLEQDPIEKSKLKEVLEKIVVQSQRASDVIQRLRSYIRKPTSEGRVPLDINTVMQEVVMLAEVDSRINGVSITFEPTEELPATLADDVQVQQVALNLIRNAMEAMRGAPDDFGGVRVRTYLDGDEVGFAVEDRGCGLSAEMEEKLFSPFVTTKEGGMGVGLSICQSIVQAHGGSIGYRANPKGGAIFYCQFPVR